MSATLEIIAYSDYVCPWCYIALERVERLQTEFPVSVEWRPFELHPETPKTGAHLAGRLGNPERARAYRDNILALARESDLEMRMPAVVANSHRALEAAEFVRERHTGGEVFAAYHRGLFRAYFEAGADINDPDVLCDLAREIGADDQALRQSLADDRYADAIDLITTEARASEVLSTPTFVFEGGFRLTGAQDYNVFASITSRLLARRAG